MISKKDLIAEIIGMTKENAYEYLDKHYIGNNMFASNQDKCIITTREDNIRYMRTAEINSNRINF